MELLQLKYFREVAKENSITKAAENLYITQPSLSNSIRRLEEELGMPLFDRVGRKIRLNEYGKLFLEGVEHAFKAMETSRARMEALLRQEREKVRIISTTSLQVYPSLVKPLVEFCPNLAFLPGGMAGEEALQALKSNEADLCLLGTVDSLPEDSQLESSCVSRQRLCIVAARGHALAKEGAVRLAELREQPFACGYLQKGQLASCCERAGFEPRILFESGHLRDLLSAVESGRYILLAAWEACLNSGAPVEGLVPLEIVDYPYELERRLYWRKNDTAVANVLMRKAILSFFADGEGEKQQDIKQAPSS